MKQKQIRSVKRGGKKLADNQHRQERSKLERRGPLPPRWWKKELNDRDDERAWLD